MIRIELTDIELRIGSFVGRSRNKQAKDRNLKELIEELDGELGHIIGATGEIAVARAMNVYFPASVGTFKGERDVHIWEVRTRGQHKYGGEWSDLLVRPGDVREAPFVHVTSGTLLGGSVPAVLCVHGWLYGYEAMRYPLEARGGYDPAHWVPVGDLRELDKLPMTETEITPEGAP